jgi:hypothetical protein
MRLMKLTVVTPSANAMVGGDSIVEDDNCRGEPRAQPDCPVVSWPAVARRLCFRPPSATELAPGAPDANG